MTSLMQIRLRPVHQCSPSHSSCWTRAGLVARPIRQLVALCCCSISGVGDALAGDWQVETRAPQRRQVEGEHSVPLARRYQKALTRWQRQLVGQSILRGANRLQTLMYPNSNRQIRMRTCWNLPSSSIRPDSPHFEIDEKDSFTCLKLWKNKCYQQLKFW